MFIHGEKSLYDSDSESKSMHFIPNNEFEINPSEQTSSQHSSDDYNQDENRHTHDHCLMKRSSFEFFFRLFSERERK